MTPPCSWRRRICPAKEPNQSEVQSGGRWLIISDDRLVLALESRDQKALGALSHDDLVQLNGLLRKVMLSLD